MRSGIGKAASDAQVEGFMFWLKIPVDRGYWFDATGGCHGLASAMTDGVVGWGSL